jgi:glycosyltransferase involved in cell wall biosynthesis
VRIAIATDAWAPQTNGVVTTLTATVDTLRNRGHEVKVISPQGLFSIPCPSYPEIRLVIAPGRTLARELTEFRPQAIHIATEGPIGIATRRYCLRRNLAFTTSYHTKYPEYLRARWPIPEALSYAWLRRFHGAAARTFVSSQSLQEQLAGRGFHNLHLWRRGVDLQRFRPPATPASHPLLAGLPRPLMTYVGRLAPEKNLEAFLRLQLPGTKLLIGDGPQRTALMARHTGAVFAGYRYGAELVTLLSLSDVFVFPSCTDTFGLAMIEAAACGVPVAAFPVPGPLDVIEQGVTGWLHENLGTAIRGALQLNREVCAQRAAAFTWAAATEQFVTGLEPIPPGARAALAVPRGSAMIAHRQPSGAGDAH